MGQEPPVPGWLLGADGNWYPPSSSDFVPAPEQPHAGSSTIGHSPAVPSASPGAPPVAPRAPTAKFGVINPRAPEAPAHGPAPALPTKVGPEPLASTGAARPGPDVADDPAPTAVMWAADSLPPHSPPPPPGAPPPPKVAAGALSSPAPKVMAGAAASRAHSTSAADIAGATASAFFGLVKFIAAVLVVGTLVVAGVSYYNSQSKPTTRSEVCAGFEDLRSHTFKGNGYFDNPVFTSARVLGGQASRYPDNAKVQANGAALTKIGEGSSTTIGELNAASRNIAAMCGVSPLLF